MIHEIIPLTGPGEGATLTTYVRPVSSQMGITGRTAVIICPGGAYERVSEREAEPVALRYLAAGYQAFVLFYSVAPARFPTALCQLALAVALVRSRAEQWGIEKNRIVVSGFSAGGHLAGCLAAFWKQPWLTDLCKKTREQIRPDGVILCYPVVSFAQFGHVLSGQNLLGPEADAQSKHGCCLEQQSFDPQIPFFIWHTLGDQTVPLENSLMLAATLRKQQVDFELHVYQVGRHGLSLADEETDKAGEDGYVLSHCSSWFSLALNWLSLNPT